MISKRILCTICCIFLICGMFSGCGERVSSTPTEPAVPIEIKDNIPVAVQGTAYDLTKLITEEKGVEYTFAASYTDPKTGALTELKVRKGRITPEAEADILVTVTAMCGEKVSSQDFIVPVKITADIIDKLLVAQSAQDVSISLCKDTNYIYGQTSISSIKAEFSKNAELLTLSNYALQAYYTAQVWRNAAVRFWVYNPMERDMELKLSAYDSDANLELLWDSPENTQLQIAKAGQWTEIAFSLYDLGIVTPIFDSVEYPEEKYLKVLASCTGEGASTLYIDGLDIFHAVDIEGMSTGYTKQEVPAGDFTDLLSSCKIYSDDAVAQLTRSSKGNGSSDAYCFGAEQKCGHPMFNVDFPELTDISGFDYLKFDVFAENSYPWVSVAVRYLDENNTVQKRGVSYDFKRDQWQTIYLNLDYIKEADLTRVIGISFSLHMESKFVESSYNCVYFDNLSLYVYEEDEPAMSPATTEDDDIISVPFYTTNTKLNTNGVCKVATDETGLTKSESTLLFWTNNSSGYPHVNATFMYEQPQDWSQYSVLSFDTHQVNAHYWMGFDILYLDENGKQKMLTLYHDTVLTNWLTNNAPLSWFKTADGDSAKPELLERVVGFRISANLTDNITDEVGYVFFDNFYLS